jgi:5'-nucleotidase
MSFRNLFITSTLSGLLGMAGCGGEPQPSAASSAGLKGPVDVRIVAINDLHGNIKKGSAKVAGVPAGGAAYLATLVSDLRAASQNSIFVSAGDLIGASPIESGAFHDEPTILAMNLMGLDLSTVGNHEFDEGQAELKRMQEGGCHPVDGCYTDTVFPGASFAYMSANVDRTDANGNLTFFRPYFIRSFQGVKIAFVGTVLDETPSIVFPDYVKGLAFEDEANTVNALVPELQAQGVAGIVVLTHEGGQVSSTSPYNGCDGFNGDIIPFTNKLDPAVVAVVSGHTHKAYNCLVPRSDGVAIPVTQALNNGLLATTIDLSFNRDTGALLSISAENHIARNDSSVTPDPAVQALVDQYVAMVAPVANRIIGSSTAFMAKPINHTYSWATLGSLVADAQLESTSPATRGGAQIALVNAGGVRENLQAGDITYGAAYAIQPFSNQLVTMTLTKAQILELLEEEATLPLDPRTLQPSAGFSFTFSKSGSPHASNVLFNGAPLDDAATYRVTVNNFMAAGGDNFSILTHGTNLVTGEIDLDAFIAYLGNHIPVSPPESRVTFVP